MEEEEIDVGTYDDANPEPMVVEFQCEVCKFVGKSDRSLSAHRRHNHPELVKMKPSPARARGRPRKESTDDSDAVVPQRVTTKELLGGRKRPKTFVEPNIDDSALRTNQEASRLHELGVVDEETPIGDYLRRGDRYAMMEDDMDPEDMIVGEEVVIGGGEHEVVSPLPQRRLGTQRRRFGDKLAPRIAIGDPEGKYKCYVETCAWRGGYRSLRMDHMRAVHPDWKMPSRYLLQRISKDNVYIDPKDHLPPFPCTVEGCEWRGNYRASRSAHMKKAHPNEHAVKKKNMPGYNSNGTYSCHYPACTWRGWSRSTRSSHLKRAHPEWRPEDTRILILLTCFHCKSVFNTYPLLVTHIATHGGIGLHVDETFESREEFSKWMHRIEASYSMSFERHDPMNAEFQDTDPEPNMYILHCSVIGHRGHQLANDARNYVYSTHSYLKRRPHYMMTRPKCDCSAHLEVREDPHYGTINVKGSLEHTGHRFGTPLLRMHTLERQLFCDLLNWKGDEISPEILGLDMLDRIVANEGFTMDNYGPPADVLLMDPLDADQLVSIKQLISQSDAECFFGVKFDENDPTKMHFGYQNLEMQKYWGRYAPNGFAVIDTVLLDFQNLELFQYTVIVVDENNTPKCAMLYLSSEQEGSPEIILERLVQLDPREPKVFLTDPSEVWVPLMEKYYGGDDPEKPRPLPEVLISEWSLMDYWACKVQQYTENEIDMFLIIAGLRRVLRSDDAVQLYSFFVELFETFYESGYDTLAHFFDMQLTDVDYMKRWNPLKRSGFISHSHPLLCTASRILRATYLGMENIGRVDQWFAHATKRIEDYNLVDATTTFTVKQVELPRKFYYGMMTPAGHEIISNPHILNPHDAQNAANTEEVIIYEDGEEGEEVVVGEEVIGHVNAEGVEILYENVEIREGEFPEPQIEAEAQNPESSEEGQKEKEKASEKEQVVREEVVIDQSEVREREEVVKGVDRQQRPASPPQPPPRRIPPHRLPVPPDTQPHPIASESPPPPRPNPLRRIRGTSQRVPMESEPSTSTARPTRETTKSVVRNRRRKRDRFADLRDCPPEVMRAIAAHAIAYDGRKKEQHPFQFVPIPAKMAQGTVPEIPTPDLRAHSVPSMRRLMGHQQLHHNQQRLRELQQRRAQVRQNRWRDEMAEDDEMDQRPSTSSNPNLHPGHPIHHPRQNLRPPPSRIQREYVAPHRMSPGTQQARARMFHERPQYPTNAQRQRHPIYREDEDVDVDVEEIEEVVEVVEEEIDVGTHQYYEEIYQEEGYEQEEETEVVVEHGDVIEEEVIEEEVVDVDGEIDDQQPCTSASLYR